MENKCVCCGREIPEGRMVCWACERQAKETDSKWDKARLETKTEKVKYRYRIKNTNNGKYLEKEFDTKDEAVMHVKKLRLSTEFVIELF